MTKIYTLLCMIGFMLLQHTTTAKNSGVNEPDSVYLFSYTTDKNDHKNGLHFAWSINGADWMAIGPEYSYLKSDYGRWGAEKRMYNPYLLQGRNGTWHCVWTVNNRDHAFAMTSSSDLINWKPQSYPKVKEGTTFQNPVLAYDQTKKLYNLHYTSANGKSFHLSSADLKTYSPAQLTSDAVDAYSLKSIHLPEGEVKGQLHKVSWWVADKLIKAYENKQFKSQQNNEKMSEDPQRFAGLENVRATFTVHPNKNKPISELLTGIFFEDINYAADGGLYAELVQNRDFEYALSDKEGHDKHWNSKYSWSIKGDSAGFTIDSLSPIHVNNPHYAVLNVNHLAISLQNSGFDGIPVKKGEQYDFSVFARQLEGKLSGLRISLTNQQGELLATATVNISSRTWKNTKTTLTALADAADAILSIQPIGKGRLALDMISLFPRKTFKNRKNGLRADLAQTIAAIHPRFMRFPGGCVAHGDGIDNIYQWKNTIGPLEARKPQRNLWGYHQTVGLGYFEYFQFCEDMGALPLPVIAAGVPCQNSATGGAGQQGGIPLDQMDVYIQDIFDLVEWANGDVNTPWGKKRAAAGHPKPFGLKYIGIGNEDLISEVFEERFIMIFNAMKQKHPEITVIGTVGPNAEGSDYQAGWDLATKLKVPIVDEHYYQNAGWFIHNQDYYDRYDRSKSKVYLGEYAAFLPGRPSNLETALAEALYMTTLERNGDVVSMASYAPLLAKEGHTQWNPDLIYFNNNEVKPTVGYEIQKLFGTHAGNSYIPAEMQLNNNREDVKKRIAYSFVSDSLGKELFIKVVNLLPVLVDSKINLTGIPLASTKSIKTVLTGKPTDKELNTLVSELIVSDQFTLPLPAYSCTIIRMKIK